MLGANFLALKNLTDDYRFGVASITLPRLPASSGSEVPHIFTRKSRVRPKEILITSAKRLFQQYRSTTGVISGRGLGLLRPNKRSSRDRFMKQQKCPFQTWAIAAKQAG